MALLLFTLLFIWGNSCLTREQSTAVSDFVMQLLGVDRGPNPDETVHGVRKMGHFLEFLALGTELTLFVLLRRSRCTEKALFLCCCGLFVPTVDETIQIFSGRNPAIVDIWIDVAGFALGCSVGLLLLLGCKIWIKKRQSHQQSKQIRDNP